MNENLETAESSQSGFNPEDTQNKFEGEMKPFRWVTPSGELREFATIEELTDEVQSYKENQS